LKHGNNSALADFIAKATTEKEEKKKRETLNTYRSKKRFYCF